MKKLIYWDFQICYRISHIMQQIINSFTTAPIIVEYSSFNFTLFFRKKLEFKDGQKIMISN